VRQIGIVVALVFLALAALGLLHRNARLQDEIARLRQQGPIVQERLVPAAAPAPATAPILAVPDAPRSKPAAVPALSAPVAPEPAAEAAGAKDALRALSDVMKLQTEIEPGAPPSPMRAYTFSLGDMMPDFDELGLNDYQKMRVEEHQRMRDLARKANDDQYEASLRSELTPEQQKKYDEMKSGTTGALVFRAVTSSQGSPVKPPEK